MHYIYQSERKQMTRDIHNQRVEERESVCGGGGGGIRGGKF